MPPGVMKTLQGQVKSSQVKSSQVKWASSSLCRPECKQSLSESFDVAVIDDVAVIYRPTDAEAQKCRLDQFTIGLDASTTCSTSLGSV